MFDCNSFNGIAEAFKSAVLVITTCKSPGYEEYGVYFTLIGLVASPGTSKRTCGRYE